MTTENKPFLILHGPTTLQVLLCDDDAAFLEKAASSVERILSKLRADAAIHAYSQPSQIPADLLSCCHIAILDIDLQPDQENGLSIARCIRQTNAQAVILFLTNFVEYAPEGYEVQAFRYVLKRDMDQVLERYLMEALEHLVGGRTRLQLQWGGAIVDLDLRDILYLEVLQHSVSIHVLVPSAVFAEGSDPGAAASGSGLTTPNAPSASPTHVIRTYTVTASLSSFEQELARHEFLRIHKSYLVNMRHIRRFQCKELVLTGGISLRVSEKNYAEQKKKYLLWKGWQS